MLKSLHWEGQGGDVIPLSFKPNNSYEREAGASNALAFPSSGKACLAATWERALNPSPLPPPKGENVPRWRGCRGWIRI
ncbi:MAG: hypothetical protein NUV76_03630 [Candidatus Kuenenia sp.]|nr:hypothetical protein [Candidatus Kuenenia sp.]